MKHRNLIAGAVALAVAAIVLMIFIWPSGRTHFQPDAALGRRA